MTNLQILNLQISQLDLPPRFIAMLRGKGINLVVDLFDGDFSTFKDIRQIGPKRRRGILEVLFQKGYCYGAFSDMQAFELMELKAITNSLSLDLIDKIVGSKVIKRKSIRDPLLVKSYISKIDSTDLTFVDYEEVKYLWSFGFYNKPIVTITDYIAITTALRYRWQMSTAWYKTVEI